MPAVVGVPPGDDGSIGLERREGVASGEDLADTRAELAGHSAAITTAVAPADDGAIGLQRCKSVASGEDLADTQAELAGHRAAVTAADGVTPGDNRAIGLQGGEGGAS